MGSYGKFAYVYDELMKDMPYDEWLHFAHAAWAKYSNGSPRTVVELGCGTGSLSIPLAMQGYEVTGIDLSADMLSVAHQKIEQLAGGSRLAKEGKIRLVQQDMTVWNVSKQVDTVISFCDCLNYLLTKDEVVQTFKQTFDGLVQGGTFLFDVHHPNTFVRYIEEQPFVWDSDAVAYIWTCDLNPTDMIIEHDLTIFAQEDGSPDLYRRFEEVHIERAYEPEWIEQELLKCGFSKVCYFADFTWDEVDDDASRLFFVAVK